MEQPEILFFRKKLLQWASKNHRPMPWKGERNPYFIWLSEIILQQTRVEQGLPYFIRFKEKYPTVTALANAPLDEVLLLWEGLGYYSRARNLHHTSQTIATKFGGKFPKKYDDILALKGVGEYTAAAIASFAYDMPKAVVDGNVIRVLSRYCGIKTAFDTTIGKKKIKETAAKFLIKEKSAIYNQAIMDFGAVMCMPQLPNCENCPLHTKCVAYQQNIVNQLPQKAKKISIRERHFLFFVIKEKNKIIIEKRTEKDIWQDLYQLPAIEINQKDIPLFFKSNPDFQLLQQKKQLLSHQRIIGHFVSGKTDKAKMHITDTQNWKEVKLTELSNFAFPRIINLFLKENNLS